MKKTQPPPARAKKRSGARRTVGTHRLSVSDVRGAVSPGRSSSGSESSATGSFQAQGLWQVCAWPDVRGAVSPGEASQAVRPRQLVSFQVSVVQPIRNSSYHGNMREWVMGWVVRHVSGIISPSVILTIREWDNRLTNPSVILTMWSIREWD